MKPPEAFIKYTPDMNARGRATTYNLLRQIFQNQTVVQDGHLGWSDARGRHISYAEYSHQRRMILRVQGVAVKGGGVHINRPELWDVIYPENRKLAPPPEMAVMAPVQDEPVQEIQDIQTPLEMMAIRTFYEGAIATYCQANPSAATFFNQIRQRADRLFAGG